MPIETDQETRYATGMLAACMIPWTSDWQLDVPKFEEHIKHTVSLGYQNLYLMGSAGEGYAMSDDRFRQVVEVFASVVIGDEKKNLDPQIGVISMSMDQVIERIGFSYDLGFRMFQISMPSWGALDKSETMLFFRTVCGLFGDCRFLHYNLPRVGRLITGPEYRVIADTVPNLVATKNSTTDYARTADIMTHTPDLQHFFLEGNYAMGCTLGQCSLLSSFAGIFPKTVHEFYASGQRKDFTETFRITKLLRDVGQHLFAHCNRTMIDGSYDKTYVWLRDSAFSNRVLPPYLGLSEEESRVCRQVFDKHYIDLE